MKKTFLFLMIGVFLVLIYIKENTPSLLKFDSPTKASGGLSFTLPDNSSNKKSANTNPVVDWPVIHDENGLLIHKADTGLKNYLFVIDPTQNNISVKNQYGKMDSYWEKVSNPVCIFNAGFFEPDTTPTFPIIENQKIIPGTKITALKIPVRILYGRGSKLEINDIKTNNDVTDADWAMSGINPSYYIDDGTITNRTVVGIKDNLLYIFMTQNWTIEDLTNIFTEKMELDSKNIVAFDSGYSSQVRCFDTDYLSSQSDMGSVLIISK